MTEPWHIPRASLGGSSSGSASNASNKSNSNPPTVTRNHRHPRHLHEGNFNLGYVNSERTTPSSRDKNSSRGGKGRGYQHYQHYQQYKNNPTLGRKSLESLDRREENGRRSTNPAKRGSRSSQGSTDSNNSSHSASSGSLLLTAANLERFADIQSKQEKLENNLRTGRNYNANIRQHRSHPKAEHPTSTDTTTNNNNDTVLQIDPNLDFIKTKEADTISIASSTHFTMVNGEGGPPRKIKEGLCGRGKQVTVLILSMSTIFLIGILGMVYAMEMRAREMPQS